MGPLKELSRVQYMSYANVSEGEHHLPHTPGLPAGIVVRIHLVGTVIVVTSSN